MFRKECFETINITRPRDLQGKLDHSCRLLGKELWHILCIYQLIKITPASRRTRAKLSYRQCRTATNSSRTTKWKSNSGDIKNCKYYNNL